MRGCTPSAPRRRQTNDAQHASRAGRAVNRGMIGTMPMPTRALPLAFLLLASCAVGCSSNHPPGAIVGEGGEYLKPKFDQREWKTVNQREAKNVSITETVPKGQSRAKWTESLGGGFRSYAVHADVGLEAL